MAFPVRINPDNFGQLRGRVVAVPRVKEHANGHRVQLVIGANRTFRDESGFYASETHAVEEFVSFRNPAHDARLSFYEGLEVGDLVQVFVELRSTQYPNATTGEVEYRSFVEIQSIEYAETRAAKQARQSRRQLDDALLAESEDTETAQTADVSPAPDQPQAPQEPTQTPQQASQPTGDPFVDLVSGNTAPVAEPPASAQQPVQQTVDPFVGMLGAPTPAPAAQEQSAPQGHPAANVANDPWSAQIQARPDDEHPFGGQ